VPRLTERTEQRAFLNLPGSQFQTTWLQSKCDLTCLNNNHILVVAQVCHALVKKEDNWLESTMAPLTTSEL